MRYKIYSLLSIFVWLAVSSQAVGQRDEVHQLDEYVVTATKTPKKLKDVPVVTTVISSADIEKLDATTISDVLEDELPGVEFETTMAGTQAINIQGMGGNDVLFLIDGERMAGETFDNIDFNRLNMSNVERIEIVKGAGSTLYGSNAVGGVINIITKEAKKPLSLNTHFRMGRNQDIRTGFNLGLKKNKITSTTDAVYKNKDTYDLIGRDRTATPERIYGGKDAKLDEKLTFAVSDRWTLTAHGSYYRRLRDYHSYRGYDHRFQDALGGIKSVTQIGDSTQLTASYLFDRYWKDVVYVDYARDDMRKYENNQHTAKLMLSHRFHRAGELIAGAEIFYEYLLSDQFELDLTSRIEEQLRKQGLPTEGYTYEIVSGTPYDTHRQNTEVIYAQHDVDLGLHFNLVYGLRLDYHSSFGANLSPKLNLMWKIQPITIRATYAGGFRAPNLKELYMDYDAGDMGIVQLIGNPDLIPETSDNFSLSTELNKGRWDATASGYVSRKHHYIEGIYTTTDTIKYFNHGNTTIAGFDLSLSCRLPKSFRIKANYAYVHQTYNIVNFSTTRPHSATVRLDYHHDSRSRRYAFDASLGGKLYGSFDCTAYSTTTRSYVTSRYPTYTMWKLTTTHHFDDYIHLTVGVDNIFNYRPSSYTVVTSYSQGISLFAGLSIDVDKWLK